LHFGTDQTELHKAFAENEKQLKLIQTKGGPIGGEPPQLSIANGLWAQKEHPFVPAFLNIATNDYTARLEQVDLRTAAEPARKEINDWVSDRTKEKIKDLIAPGAVDRNTRLVLVNAIYFKGTWAEQFKKAQTTDQPFFVTPAEKVQTRMMKGSADYQYAETDTLQLLEMPYTGYWISMVVLLPKDPHGLATLENSLNQKQLDDWLAGAHSRKVNVFLPRFKLTQKFNLSKTLAAMGMTDAFSIAANFSGMDGQRDLFISAVIHKAYADVNEEGTEAAAATGVVMTRSAMRKPEPAATFRADHPFLFLIRDTRSGSILFLGRVTNPTK
jgi:serpin B